MRRVTLNIDKQCYTYKPDDRKEIGAIQNRLATAKTTVTVEELANYINSGATIKAAALNGAKADSWESQDIFCLNINNKDCINSKKYLSIEAALERCETYRVKPAFIYETFNSRKDSNGAVKFRIVFVMDRTITDSRVSNAVQLALLKLFHEADTNCKDAAKMFFGSPGKVMAVAYTNTINAVNVIQSMVNYIKIEKSANASRDIKGYCNNAYINQMQGVPHVKFIDEIDKTKYDLFNANSIINYYIIKSALYQSFFEMFDFSISNISINENNTQTVYNKQSEREVERNFNFIQLEDNCKLYREFVKGKRRAVHEEAMHLAYNLLHIEGGIKRLIQAQELYIDYPKLKLLNKIESFRYAAKVSYSPSRCSKDRCPFYNECDNAGINILHAVNLKRGNIRRLDDEIKLITLELAELKTEIAIREALKNTDVNEMNVVVSPTGIGKSTMLQRMAQENNSCFNNTLICVPTHRLAEELGNKLKPYVKDLLIIKEPVINDEEVKVRFTFYQSIGNYNEAKEILENYLIDLNIFSNDSLEDIEMQKNSINEYIKALAEAKTTNNPILCTHAKMFFLDNPNVERVIVDEDILNSYLQTINIYVKELLTAIERAEVSQLDYLQNNLQAAYDFFNSLTEGTTLEIVDFPKINVIDKEEIDELLDGYVPIFNIFDMLNAEAAVKSSTGIVTVYKKNKLPNLPITVLSATANEKIYTSIFKDKKIKFSYVDNVELKGNIIFHPKYAMSRTYLKDKLAKASAIIKAEAPGVSNMITFKSYVEQFKESGFNMICNYGACSGIDAYGGQDLIVAGTPHFNVVAYLILAHACGIKEKINLDMSYIPIKRNGFEFYFYTFNSNTDEEVNKLLQEIQFYKIESELVQAVGRARALRKDCTVHVFSRLPIKNCNLYGEEAVNRKVGTLGESLAILHAEVEVELAKEDKATIDKLINDRIKIMTSRTEQEKQEIIERARRNSKLMINRKVPTLEETKQQFRNIIIYKLAMQRIKENEDSMCK